MTEVCSGVKHLNSILFYSNNFISNTRLKLAEKSSVSVLKDYMLIKTIMKMEVKNRPHNRYDMDMGKDMLNIKGVSV